MIISLQYLRAIAVILVLLIHTSDKSIQYGIGLLDFRDGRFGVDIFFVISGFVMYYVSLKKKAGVSSIYSFLKHRLIRILPLYWVLTSIALIIFLIMGENAYHGGEINIAKSYFLFPTNFPKEKFLIPIGWTLSYEFYFYFIFAITLFLSKYRATLAIFILTFMVFMGMYIDINKKYVLLNFLTNSLLLEFMYGILIVKAYQLLTFKKVQFSILFMTLFIISYTLYYLKIKTGYRGIDLGIPAMFLVLSIVMLEDKIRNNVSKLMLTIGESSFSIYLIHPFILSASGLVYKKIGINTILSEQIFIVLMIISSLIAGYITYNLLEKRMTILLRTKYFP